MPPWLSLAVTLARMMTPRLPRATTVARANTPQLLRVATPRARRHHHSSCGVSNVDRPVTNRGSPTDAPHPSPPPRPLHTNSPPQLQSVLSDLLGLWGAVGVALWIGGHLSRPKLRHFFTTRGGLGWTDQGTPLGPGPARAGAGPWAPVLTLGVGPLITALAEPRPLQHSTSTMSQWGWEMWIYAVCVAALGLISLVHHVWYAARRLGGRGGRGPLQPVLEAADDVATGGDDEDGSGAGGYPTAPLSEAEEPSPAGARGCMGRWVPPGEPGSPLVWAVTRTSFALLLLAVPAIAAIDAGREGLNGSGTEYLHFHHWWTALPVIAAASFRTGPSASRRLGPAR